MLKLTLTAISLAAIAGCSIFGQPAAEKVADVIDEYCEREPENQRRVYRESINAELAGEGHTVQIVCNGDALD